MTREDYEERRENRRERAEAISILFVLIGFIAGLSTGSITLAPWVILSSLFLSVMIQIIPTAIADYEREHKEDL